MDRNIELFLESHLLKSGKDVISYNKLSEDAKQKLSKDLVSAVYSSIKKKSLEIDYSLIEATKGDITKFKEYSTLTNCIKFLEQMAKNAGIIVKEVNTLRLAHDNLVAKKNIFIDAYRDENEAIMLLYNNVVMSLIYATSIVVLTMIDYSKKPNGSYDISYKTLDDDRKANNYIKCLDDFNKMVVSGKLAKCASANASRKNLTAGTISVIGVVLLLSMIVPIIRGVIHCFYQSRVNISDELRTQAYFLEINMNDPTKVQTKASREKQEKTIKKLLTIADKVDIKEKVVEKKVESEIKDEDKELTKQKISTGVANPTENDAVDDLLI